ncbi:M28 family metallopeptidase [Nocardioides lentus]|uniref:M28 family metallopeptidase n=1 Tax=Nocardioides lentus TaxID=338077 RepID=A0ABP5APF9_9ACTN
MSLTPRRRTAAATAAAAIGLGLVIATPTTGAVADPSDGAASAEAKALNAGQKIRRDITRQGLREHLVALERLGTRYGGRAALTPGYDAAARYVEFQMREAGYNVTRDYYTYENAEILAESLTIDGAEPVDVPVIAMSYTSSTPEGGVTADLVQPTSVLGCEAADYDGVDVEGQVALVSRGTCSFGQKATVAGEAGAAAVIIYNNTAGDLNGTLGDAPIEGSAPAGGVTQEAGADLLAADEAGTPVTVDIRADYSEVESYNIIASSRGGDAKNTVMLGAHLDGVEGTTAVNDNGTGTAALLEVAEHLKDVKGQRNKVRFAFWGSEEVGLVGSTEYVNDLVRDNPRALDDISTYLNFDMLGSPNHIIGVYDADQSKFEASAPVPAGSIETEQLFRSYFRSQKQPSVDTEFSGRSDYQAFIENGVAAGGLFTGADDVKTPYQARIFGGTAGILMDPNYHTPSDNLANVAVGPLHTMADAIGTVAVKLSRSTAAIDVPRDGRAASSPKKIVPSGLAAKDRA